MGLTVPNNAALASAPSRGLVAYPAGCTVVLLNTRKNRQNHIINPSRKTITSLAFSEDGRYMVTGECGHAPCVRIWDVQDRTQISEFPGHKYGVNVVAFAPNGKQDFENFLGPLFIARGLCEMIVSILTQFSSCDHDHTSMLLVS